MFVSFHKDYLLANYPMIYINIVIQQYKTVHIRTTTKKLEIKVFLLKVIFLCVVYPPYIHRKYFDFYLITFFCHIDVVFIPTFENRLIISGNWN